MGEVQVPEVLWSVWGFRYCKLLLAQGQCRDVRERAEKTLAWTEESPHGLPLDKALDHLSLGQAFLGTGDLDRGRDHMEKAGHLLREVGPQELLEEALAIAPGSGVVLPTSGCS
jgi:hypothetical protein